GRRNEIDMSPGLGEARKHFVGPAPGEFPAHHIAMTGADEATAETQWRAFDVKQPEPGQEIRHCRGFEMAACGKATGCQPKRAPVFPYPPDALIGVRRHHADVHSSPEFATDLHTARREGHDARRP